MSRCRVSYAENTVSEKGCWKNMLLRKLGAIFVITRPVLTMKPTQLIKVSRYPPYACYISKGE